MIDSSLLDRDKNYELHIVFFLLVLIAIDWFVTPHVSTTRAVLDNFGPVFQGSGVITYIFVLLLALFFIIIKNKRGLRNVLVIFNLIMTVFLIDDVATLIRTLPQDTHGMTILFDAFWIWLYNLFVFSIWYWLLDRRKQTKGGEEFDYDFVFPQEESKYAGAQKWKPSYFDYLFLSFNSSLAFTPTDVKVLSARVKCILMIQAILSLTVLLVIAARAIAIIN